MKSLTNWWNGLTSNQKFFVVVFLIVTIWVLRNAIKGAIQGASDKVQQQSETAMLQAQGIKPSYSESEYKSMANKLFEAMDGWGTNDDVVFAQFDRLNNDVDFIKLDKAFGVRTASDNMFGLIEPQDLRGWIRDDLSSESIATLNQRLKQSGISKRI